MRGSLFRRGKDPKRWTIVLDRGWIVGADGKRRRKQSWVSFHGGRKEAEARLNELVQKEERGEFVERTKLTIGGWLTEWMAKVVRPSARRPRTQSVYQMVVDNVVAAPLGNVVLQKVQAIDLQQFYGGLSHLSAATTRLHHAVVRNALRSAVKNHLIYRNPAQDVEGLPKQKKVGDGVAANCWTEADARKFLAKAKESGARVAAFYGLALDSGMRLGELCGLRWADVDFDAVQVTVTQQLIAARGDDGKPVFGPPKTACSRIIDLAPDTAALLRAHKQHQAALRLKSGELWENHDLCFTKELPDVTGTHMKIGTPLLPGKISSAEFQRLRKRAGVPRISFHGLRHTAASMMLLAGETITVVSKRLGHARVSMTLDVYSHTNPTRQREAAVRHGARLHG
jgi:integrase